MITTAIFDNDGTMRDSRATIGYACAETFKHFGLTAPSPETIADHMHAGAELLFAELAPGHDTPAMATYYRETVHSMLNTIHAYGDVHQTLEKLRDMGLRLAVVSASKFLLGDLAADKLDNYFECVVDGQMVSRPKPDPEGILIALEQLGITPQEALYIGDLPADIAMGKAAKLGATIAITHGFASREKLVQSKPDFIIDELEELAPIIAKLRG